MQHLFSLKNKNIVITGASSGIGRQCAISCSKMGATIILIARNKNRLIDTYNKLDEGKHLYFIQDITDYDKIEAIINDVCSKLGKIHGFIHSAGIEMTIPFKIMKPEYYSQLFNINVVSGFNIAQIISKNKYIGNQSSFIFISSIMSIVSNAGLIGYSTSKGALNSGIRSMAIELSKKKIRVNSISPGYIQTEMMKTAELRMSKTEIEEFRKNFLLGLGEPIDIANACLYLLADASKWVTGTNLVVDGGYSSK